MSPMIVACEQCGTVGVKCTVTMELSLSMCMFSSSTILRASSVYEYSGSLMLRIISNISDASNGWNSVVGWNRPFVGLVPSLDSTVELKPIALWIWNSVAPRLSSSSRLSDWVVDRLLDDLYRTGLVLSMSSFTHYESARITAIIEVVTKVQVVFTIL